MQKLSKETSRSHMQYLQKFNANETDVLSDLIKCMDTRTLECARHNKGDLNLRILKSTTPNKSYNSALSSVYLFFGCK